MRALILFGSESDRAVYNALIDDFNDRFETDFEIISAHRNPARLKERLAQKDYDVVVAGAGLAAHLPGVVASLTEKPVFGIPVSGNFAGIDAFLSIVQMPKGVPVLSCHPDNHWQVIKFITQAMGHTTGKVNIVTNSIERDMPLIEKTFEQIDDVAYEISENQNSNLCNLILVGEERDLCECQSAIYLPIYQGQEKHEVHKAFEFFNWTKTKGLWVGANNLQNGVLFYKRLWGALA